MRVVIVGTGTDVGKTHVSCALARAFHEHGTRIVAWKPIASGCDGGPGDAEVLAASAGTAVVPPLYAFVPPVSPHLAARRAGVTIDLDALATRADELATTTDVLLVETAGGLFSPLAPGLFNADLALRLGADRLVLVAPDRIGVLHDVQATCVAAEARGVRIDLVVLSAVAAPDASSGTNAGEVRALLGRSVAAVFPRAPLSAAETLAAADQLRAAVASLRRASFVLYGEDAAPEPSPMKPPALLLVSALAVSVSVSCRDSQRSSPSAGSPTAGAAGSPTAGAAGSLTAGAAGSPSAGAAGAVGGLAGGDGGTSGAAGNAGNGAGGNAGSGGGSDAGSSGTGGAGGSANGGNAGAPPNSPDCPAAVPQMGSACSAAGLSCHWSNGSGFCSDVDAHCTGVFWNTHLTVSNSCDPPAWCPDVEPAIGSLCQFAGFSSPEHCRYPKATCFQYLGCKQHGTQSFWFSSDFQGSDSCCPPSAPTSGDPCDPIGADCSYATENTMCTSAGWVTSPPIAVGSGGFGGTGGAGGKGGAAGAGP